MHIQIDRPRFAGDSWKSQSTSFWALGQEFSSRLAAACNMNAADVMNHSNGLKDISASMRSAAFL